MSWGSPFLSAWSQASGKAREAAAALATGARAVGQNVADGAAWGADKSVEVGKRAAAAVRDGAAFAADKAAQAAAWAKQRSIEAARWLQQQAIAAGKASWRALMTTLALHKALVVAAVAISRLSDEIPLGTGSVSCAIAEYLRANLTPSQAREALPYAGMSSAVYDDGPLPAGWSKVDPTNTPGLADAVFEDPKTNFKAALYKGPNGQMVLAFKGTDPTSGKDLLTDAYQGFGGVPEQYLQADKLAARVAIACQPPPVAVTGHSLGGGLATYAGMQNGLEVRAFNAAGLSSGVRDAIGKAKFDRNSPLVTNYNAVGDLVSDPAPLLVPGTPLGLDAEQPGEKLFFASPARGPVTKHMMSTGVVPGLEAAAASP